MTLRGVFSVAALQGPQGPDGPLGETGPEGPKVSVQRTHTYWKTPVHQYRAKKKEKKSALHNGCLVTAATVQLKKIINV